MTTDQPDRVRLQPCIYFRPVEWFDWTCADCGYGEEDHQAQADADERFLRGR